MTAGSPPPTSPLEFTCPRCASPTAATYYGPCGPYREALVAAFGGAGREVEVAAYEPKVNVTPNAVALKE